ncbi:hypothetical protein [Streptomyces poonensis]|uniref:Uncharacterized protein n=1 Tax=Streptomyces poonensis TaxID=68255 RepID=A0A918PXQ2_9ACTN|nr:hypothetical protein [Streptomyces poonensis]GGZ26455.1 hypothetical protein GCM10010365_53540 [Streptomyces poonensis]GLJ88982.1 hypothetical protein GCM10017589_15820 [Streptomyces poonensis]
MTSTQDNDQRLLDRILGDQHRKPAPEKSRDDFFTFFAADKALQSLDLDNDEIMDGIVDGAHDCGIDGIWTFVDERYVTADSHQFLPSRASKIDLVILQANDHLSDDLMSRMAGTLEQNFKTALRHSKAGGVDRIARTPEFTTRVRQAVIAQSRYHIEH